MKSIWRLHMASKTWPVFAFLTVMAFPFENLEVYKRSIQFISTTDSILSRESAHLNRSIIDQLSRAALSIPLNIAEGNGRWHNGDKRNFFWISRGSAFECIPLIEILFLKGAISEGERSDLRNQIEAIAKMLTRLVQVHSETNHTKRKN